MVLIENETKKGTGKGKIKKRNGEVNKILFFFFFLVQRETKKKTYKKIKNLKIKKKSRPPFDQSTTIW